MRSTGLQYFQQPKNYIKGKKDNTFLDRVIYGRKAGKEEPDDPNCEKKISAGEASVRQSKSH